MTHPWAILIGAAAIALPIVVHLLTKPKPQRLPLSTLRFVRDSIRQQRSRHWLRDFIVLATRVIAIALIAFAIARPQIGEQPLVSDARDGAAVRIVIVDVSQSMAAIDRGVAAIERARTTGASHLRYRAGLRANLILAGSQPRAIFETPSQNLDLLRQELSQADARPERLDIRKAINVAAAMMASEGEGDQRRRELVVVSDFQRSNWASADFSALPPNTNIQFESVAPAETLPNLALLRCDIAGRAAVGSPARIVVEVGNYSPTPRLATIEVSLGSATYRMEGTCAAGKRTTLTQEFDPPAVGWNVGQARLIDSDDPLSADNTRGLVASFQDRPEYLLITQQSAFDRPSSTHYLECALVPDVHLGDDAAARVSRLLPADIEPQALAPADLLVVDHPGKIPAAGIEVLAEQLRRGKPLLYVASETIDATNLQLLATASKTDLRLPVTFAPASRGLQRRDLFLTSVQQDAEPFRIFGQNTAAVTSALRFGGGLSSRRVEDSLDDDVLATYNDGTACLVLGRSDVAAIAVLNADLTKSNVATSGTLVPLLDQLVEQLLASRGSFGDALCGEVLVARLPRTLTTVDDLELVGPAARDDITASGSMGELRNDGVGVVWSWDEPDVPGVYRVVQDGTTVFAKSLHVPTEESQLEAISPDVLQNRLATGQNVYYRSAATGGKKRDVLWAWILVGCVVAMMGEVVALIAFRN